MTFPGGGASRARADRFVVEALAGQQIVVSRAVVQRLFEDGLVTRDGRPLKSSAELKPGDSLLVDASPAPPSTLAPDPSMSIDVVFEDADLIVVHKPAGVVVHPAKSHREHTLIQGLLARGGFDAETLEDCARPGVVHRLDKGTSGLLVVAKTVRARDHLKALFQAHTIDREYVALVVGEADSRTYDTAHGRHERDRKRFTSMHPAGLAKRAITHVQVAERLLGLTLVQCRLETGRTHQIRVHLAERSRTPVLGDPMYGAQPGDPFLRALAEGLGHQALHARVLGFTHPRTGTTLRFERPPPDDFQRALEAARERPTKPSTSRGPST